MTLLKLVLQQLGFDEERFMIDFVDEEQPEKYQSTIEDYIQKIKELGPNPIVPVAVGAGILVVALLGGLVWNHIIYGDWKCAFRHCVVAPGWHEP